ncbi:MAG: SIS domain-containing protein [Deinococcales bacterium]
MNPPNSSSPYAKPHPRWKKKPSRAAKRWPTSPNPSKVAAGHLFLGRSINFPTALEGALKLKEISYIHAEAYATGELKHGPIALIDHEMPVVAIATASSLYEKTISNIQEVKARDGIVIALTNPEDKLIQPTRRSPHPRTTNP